MEKLDLKRQFREFYLPSARHVSLVNVPEMRFLVLEGHIEPGETPGTSSQFSRAIGVLYGFAYTLKFMSKQRSDDPIDYGVMALEGLWTTPAGGEDYLTATEWSWTLMIMQPGHIDQQMLASARLRMEEKREKETRKAARAGERMGVRSQADPDPPADPLDLVRLEDFAEGLSVQIMHVGPYAEEPRSLDKMTAFAEQSGYEFHGKHHEIYLGDPRTAKPENLKTVLRHPIRPLGREQAEPPE